MRMTDRPRTEFFFHHSLKGAIAFSTAVDAVPGGSRAEKQKEFFRRSTTTQKNIHKYEQAPSEVNFWPNIIKDGKYGALAGLESATVIFDLDQSMPAHKGRKYIPFLMGVGKHDSLVYFGFEELYEVYKKMHNVEAHYLDRLPHSETKELEHVGHLLGRLFKSRKNRTHRRFLARKFIAKQLALEAMKGYENRVLKFLEILRNPPPEWEKSDLKNEMDAISSPEFLSQIDNPQITKDLLTLRRRVSSRKISGILPLVSSLETKIEEQIDRKVNAADIAKSEDRGIPNFIRLLQSFSNNLAFREFSTDHIYHSEKSTELYTSIFRETLPAIGERLNDLLDPYSSPIKRISYLLDNISVHLSDYKKLAFLISDVRGMKKTQHIKGVVSEKLFEDLEILSNNVQEVLKIANDTQMSQVEKARLLEPATFEVQEKINQIREDHKKFLASLKRSNKRSLSPLVKKLINKKMSRI